MLFGNGNKRGWQLEKLKLINLALDSRMEYELCCTFLGKAVY